MPTAEESPGEQRTKEKGSRCEWRVYLITQREQIWNRFEHRYIDTNTNISISYLQNIRCSLMTAEFLMNYGDFLFFIAILGLWLGVEHVLICSPK